MITSRNLTDLHPKVKKLAQAFKDACKAQGIEILIYCTYRDNEAQNALYAQGRTVKGKIITNAKGGDSFHNYRLAFDFVPTIGGKPLWNDSAMYKRCGAIAKSVGLEWAGDWVSLKETAHCQHSGGLSLKDLRAGKTLPI